MLDVVQKARSDREMLVAEIARVEEFLLMCEELLAPDHPGNAITCPADRAAGTAPASPTARRSSPRGRRN